MREGNIAVRAVSWIVLKVLGVLLITVIAGIGYSAVKYIIRDAEEAKHFDPFSPQAVAASAVPPIDYKQQPVPLPSHAYAPVPLPNAPLVPPPHTVASSYEPIDYHLHPPPHGNIAASDHLPLPGTVAHPAGARSAPHKVTH